LHHTFPDQVSVEYYDTAQAAVQEQYAEAIQEAQRRYWPYPLVILNDKMAAAGEVNVYHISRLIRQQLAREEQA
jgi:disulfide oxidoreductase YuzD